MKQTKRETTAKLPYFVAATDLGASASVKWVKTHAKTLEGAKRLAAGLPRGLTTIAKVARESANGSFDTVAILEDFSKITRTRPRWKTLQPAGQASA